MAFHVNGLLEMSSFIFFEKQRKGCRLIQVCAAIKMLMN